MPVILYCVDCYFSLNLFRWESGISLFVVVIYMNSFFIAVWWMNSKWIENHLYFFSLLQQICQNEKTFELCEVKDLSLSVPFLSILPLNPKCNWRNYCLNFFSLLVISSYINYLKKDENIFYWARWAFVGLVPDEHLFFNQACTCSL